jgi:formate/nitrite transporter FocA (FNT family)
MKKGVMKTYLILFLRAVLAGITIGIGGIVFLSIDIKIVGALMFTVGLYTICVQELNLFTGKVGYLPEREPAFIIYLEIIWLGNFCGTFLSAMAVRYTRGSGIAEAAKTMCQTKLNDGPLSLFLLGIFCGMLMFIAVDSYAKTKNPIILFLGVGTFILSGFEHCIADMFYFSVAGMWSPLAFVDILVITLGNSVGGMLIPAIKKIG